MKPLSQAMIVAAAGLLLATVPARADFCVEISDGFVTPSAFFHFKGSYSTKPEKITVLKGSVRPLDAMGDPTGFGPAFGEMLGLHEGDAGNEFGVTFAHGNVVGHLALTLDDNGFTTGGGRVYRPTGTTDVGGQLVDCSTQPQP